MATKRAAGEQEYRLIVPLDASTADEFKPDSDVKVVVVPCDQPALEQVVRLNRDGKGVATFGFAAHPGPVNVLVGPEHASVEELMGMQTLSQHIGSRQWQGKNELSLQAISISSYYWHWWFFWCRRYKIRGRVICPDGRPVPGAKVCAYDVDWFFIWSSTSQVGCATTDITGSFEIDFLWCCGWWPWWWWRYRIWDLDPILIERVGEVIQHVPDFSPVSTRQPSLSPFNTLLESDGLAVPKILGPQDVDKLEGIRTSLVKKLPQSAELERMRIWPWAPWWPWWDCSPDIIFKVTQDCIQPNTVIVDESVAMTRWNISSPLSVTLVANELACCLPDCPDPHCCPEGECLVITQVCGDPIDEIGGNTGAPASPVGYLYPGAVLPGTAAYNGDRPFAGIIPVEKNPGDMLGVDYYEIEHFAGGMWQPLPPGGGATFVRRWLETGSWTTGDVPFPAMTISGHNVYESRERFEATGGLAGWNVNRFWLVNLDLVVPLDTTQFADGTYRFRVVGWNVDGGGNLINPRVLPVCGTKIDNEWVLTFDNRVITSLGHPASHNCGGVHTCTLEPDTHIVQVRINGTVVDPCDTIDAKEGTLEIDFEVTDPDGHLAVYSLIDTYGLNQSVNLLAQPGAVLTALGMGMQVGPTYGEALGQGAVAPHWYGGSYRLSVPVAQAFPEPCCYQLELRGYKRTVVGGMAGITFTCEHGYAHNNLTEYTLGVGVC